MEDGIVWCQSRPAHILWIYCRPDGMSFWCLWVTIKLGKVYNNLCGHKHKIAYLAKYSADNVQIVWCIIRMQIILQWYSLQNTTFSGFQSHFSVVVVVVVVFFSFSFSSFSFLFFVVGVVIFFPFKKSFLVKYWLEMKCCLLLKLF